MNDVLATLKQRAAARVDTLRPELEALSLDIHANPEIGFQERASARKLTAMLGQHGFSVEQGAGGLETAFRAEHHGGKGPTVAILGEYDALPGVGHGCGHNLIGTAAVGAGLAIAAAAPELPGRIQVIGTPAEEGGGGKVILARAGVFDGVDAAMMFHPSRYTVGWRGSLAMVRVAVEFFGKAAHGASGLEKGINALEALIQTFVTVNGLRQHLRKDAIMHGIITDGGKAANIVPDYASAEFSVRARDAAYRDQLVDKLRGCVKAAELATGARGEVTLRMGYDNIVANSVMVDLFLQNLTSLGIELDDIDPFDKIGSTDMGDISQIVPAIHPYLKIADDSVSGHSTEFAAAAVSQVGQQAMISAAKAMAMTCLDLFYCDGALASARAEFEQALAEGRVRGRPSKVGMG